MEQILFNFQIIDIKDRRSGLFDAVKLIVGDQIFYDFSGDQQTRD